MDDKPKPILDCKETDEIGEGMQRKTDGDGIV